MHFPYFFLIHRCVVKGSEREGKIGYCNTNMADTTSLFNFIEHVNCRTNFSITTEEPSFATWEGSTPSGISNTKTSGLENLGQIKTSKAYQQTQQNYSQHLEERVLKQLTTAAGKCGLAVATTVTFSPLCKISQISCQICSIKGINIDL